MTKVLNPDLCIIGAGSGGLSVAAAAAMFGTPVVLIERGAMGGDCLNVGCVPSKALLAAADRVHDIRGAGHFGITTGVPQVHFERVGRHVKNVIDAIAPNDSIERFTALGVKVIQGEASFLDRRTVRVGEQEIEARRFVIATGSRPAIPDIAGLSSIPYLTNETIFNVAARPERLLVLGGGPIGVELGQAFRRLGSAVTIVQGDRILPREDEEAALFIARSLRADGVDLREGVTAIAADNVDGGVRLTLSNGETIEGSHLLIAAGRAPHLAPLKLEAAGVRFGPKGIEVDRSLKTSNPRVYAIGDCASGATGNLQFTHAANAHAGTVIRSALFRLPSRVDNKAMPRVTYCDPEVASVGLSEEEARKGGRKPTLLRWPFSENDRAQAERATDGIIKVVVSHKGKVLGVTIVGKNAGDLLLPWIIAVQKGWNIRQMAAFVFPYPTMSEVSKRAAMLHLSPMARQPWIRRILGFLRKLG